jgi:MraZ protein
MNIHVFPVWTGRPWHHVPAKHSNRLNLNKNGLMALFLSTYINKVDRKGRVSIPAPFRASLSVAGEAGVFLPGLVLFRASGHACLEGFPWSWMEELSARLDHYDLFSSDQDDLATAIFGEAAPLSVDADGRIVMPQELIDFAGIGEQAAFVGMGRKFQIWEPAALEKRRKQARNTVRDKGLTLPRAANGGQS